MREEIIYLVKNKKGFSVEDIKSVMIKENPFGLSFFYKVKRKEMEIRLSYETYPKHINNKYTFVSFPAGEDSREERRNNYFSSVDLTTMKNHIKKTMLKNGFKTLEDDVAITLSATNLLIDSNEKKPEYILAFKSKIESTYSEYFSKYFFKNFIKKHKVIYLRIQKLRQIAKGKRELERIRMITRKYDNFDTSIKLKAYADIKLKNIKDKEQEILKKFKDKKIGKILLEKCKNTISNIVNNTMLTLEIDKNTINQTINSYLNILQNLEYSELQDFQASGLTWDWYEKLKQYINYLLIWISLKDKLYNQHRIFQIVKNLVYEVDRKNDKYKTLYFTEVSNNNLIELDDTLSKEEINQLFFSNSYSSKSPAVLEDNTEKKIRLLMTIAYFTKECYEQVIISLAKGYIQDSQSVLIKNYWYEIQLGINYGELKDIINTAINEVSFYEKIWYNKNVIATVKGQKVEFTLITGPLNFMKT